MRVTSPAPWVAHMEINRPQKLNAFSRQVWLEFGAVFAQLSADKDVRAVVLSGRGDKAFTSGLDVQAASEEGLKDEEGLDAARKAWSLRWHIDEFQSSIGAVEKCEKREYHRLFLIYGEYYCYLVLLLLSSTSITGSWGWNCML